MDIGDKLDDLRREYSGLPLEESAAPKNPYVLFEDWFDAAVKSKVPDPHAMVLATADRSGKPSARVVLMRGFDENGFVFYTNYGSRKGREISSNPFGAVVFFWREVDRQVRAEGEIMRVTASESDRYFDSRPRESRIAAWASSQSSTLGSRKVLDDLFVKFSDEFRNRPLVRPPNWGGFRLSAERIEFWQGRPNRLHDRLLYSRDKSGSWTVARLAP